MLSKASLAFVVMLSMAQEPTLEREYASTRKAGSGLALITLIAIHEDGTPVRGFISCSGVWFKHADEQTVTQGLSLPFATDARGAIVMNPSLDDEWIVCRSEAHGASGRVEVAFDADHPRTVREIILRKDS